MARDRIVQAVRPPHPEPAYSVFIIILFRIGFIVTKEIKLILNPTADKGAAINKIPEIAAELNKHGLNYNITLTQHPWHAAELTAQAIAEGYGTVVAVGGDGTINEVLNGIMLAQNGVPHGVRMGVLPIGRGNDFAFGMGIPLDLEGSCAMLARGESQHIDVGLCKGGLYPEGRYFGNGVGIGFDAMVGFLANQAKISGFLGYLIAAIRTIVLFQTPLVELSVNGETQTQPDLMISIMNGRRMGGGFMMAPEASSEDGLFDVTIAKDMPRHEMFKLITLFMKGAQFGHHAITFLRTTGLQVKSLKGVMPTHADGETIGVDCTELDIQILAKQIDLICQLPESKSV